MSIKVFLPCREGSERVPKKNIKPFSGYSKGILQIKLNQLMSAKSIDKIYLSTNDSNIIKYADEWDNEKLIVHRRDDTLCTSKTSTDQLMEHVVDLIPEGDVLWTHVTSPFVNAKWYDRIIDAYYKGLDQGYDSLMTTTLIRSFLWQEDGPINYNRSVEKWPRTQTLPPLHEVNSAAFINSRDNYLKYQDRIGKNPKLFTLDDITAHDIDWEEDFVLAESILSAGLARL